MCQVVDIIENGKVVGRAFQCSCHRLPNGELESMEERWVRTSCEDQMREIEYEMAREATGLHDPNRIDTRRVRREFREPNVINLGRRVNLISARA